MEAFLRVKMCVVDGWHETPGNALERFDVEECCISGGWIKVPAGKTRDRKGNALMIKLKGKVEAFYL